jgi:hypothetical protein
MPLHQLNYATATMAKRKPPPRVWAATSAFWIGCTTLASDALVLIGALAHHSIPNAALFLALLLPLPGVVFAGLGDPNNSVRAALGLVASGAGLIVGALIAILWLMSHLPG